MYVSMDILKNPTVFLPATALLATVLLVWAQLWVHTRTIYRTSGKGSNPKAGDFTVYLGFIWTFIAISYALTAFAWAACSPKGIDDLAIGLFVASFSMAAVDVLVSLGASLSKLLTDRTSEPLFAIEDLRRLRLYKTWCVLRASTKSAFAKLFRKTARDKVLNATKNKQAEGKRLRSLIVVFVMLISGIMLFFSILGWYFVNLIFIAVIPIGLFIMGIRAAKND